MSLSADKAGSLHSSHHGGRSLYCRNDTIRMMLEKETGQTEATTKNDLMLLMLQQRCLVKEEASNWVVVGKKPIPTHESPEEEERIDRACPSSLNKRWILQEDTVLKRSGRQAIRGTLGSPVEYSVLEFRARAIADVKIH